MTIDFYQENMLDTMWPKSRMNLKVETDDAGVKTIKATQRQVGGNHYQRVPSNMQPWDIIDAWELDFYAGNVLKYLLRHKGKGGVEDLEKAKHYLEKMIESYEDAA